MLTFAKNCDILTGLIMNKKEDKKNKVPSRRILYWFWQGTKQYKVSFFVGFVLNVIVSLMFGFVTPVLIARLIDKITGGAEFNDVIGDIIVYGVMLVVVQIILMRIMIYMVWRRQMQAKKVMHDFCFKALVNRSMAFHNDRFSGSLLTQQKRFVNAAESFEDCINQYIVPFIIDIIAPIIVLGAIAPMFVICLLGGTAIFIAISSFTYKGSRITKKAENEAETKWTGELADDLSNVLAIKSYANEKHEQSKFAGLVKDWYKKSLAHMWNFITRSMALNFVNVGIAVAVFVFLAGAGEWWGVSIGTIILMLTFSNRLLSTMWNWHYVLKMISTSFSDSDEMVAILDEPNELKDKKNAPKLTVNSGVIDFENISFRHKDARAKVFKDLSLHVRAGEKIGLVGMSGSGKTTLTKLLLRFADVQEGAIKIDGQNIAEVTQESLRDAIAYVPQETLLFHRSLAENVAYGKLDASEKEIIEACKKANIWDFIKELPEGLKTKTGEQGVKLSGGQRQRVAIARAILKDAPILVLDEATSALDTESEKLIQSALRELMRGKTSLVIAHRLSTVAEMDRILVIKNGEIIEDGKHKDLITKNGEYAKLWKKQTEV